MVFDVVIVILVFDDVVWEVIVCLGVDIYVKKLSIRERDVTWS